MGFGFWFGQFLKYLYYFNLKCLGLTLSGMPAGGTRSFVGILDAPVECWIDCVCVCALPGCLCLYIRQRLFAKNSMKACYYCTFVGHETKQIKSTEVWRLNACPFQDVTRSKTELLTQFQSCLVILALWPLFNYLLYFLSVTCFLNLFNSQCASLHFTVPKHVTILFHQVCSRPAMILGRFQNRSRLQNWLMARQGPTVLAVGANGVVCLSFFLFLPFPGQRLSIDWAPFNQQPTNQSIPYLYQGRAA